MRPVEDQIYANTAGARASVRSALVPPAYANMTGKGGNVETVVELVSVDTTDRGMYVKSAMVVVYVSITVQELVVASVVGPAYVNIKNQGTSVPYALHKDPVRIVTQSMYQTSLDLSHTVLGVIVF